MENTDTNNEIWQVEANGKVYDTNFAEMTEWIDQGSLLRIDRVRKGNLRWIEAGKVPSLVAVFNTKDNGQPLSPVVTLTKLGPTSISGDLSANPVNTSTVVTTASVSPPTDQPSFAESVCSMHPGILAVYICGTCSSQFCKTCPNSYGGTVKVCPFCGAMCNSIVVVEETRSESSTFSAAISEGFGVGDFTRALVYPFKFKTSLIFGALMYMFFSIGQGAVAFGGIFMLGAALTCFLLANTLTFGILANTVENFSQGRIGLNFMPTFDEFSLWDDVVHPFFLSIGVYISSFGPLIVVGLVTFFMVIGTVNKEMNALQSDAARTVNPELSYAANAAKQSENVKELLNKDANVQKQRVDAINNGQPPPQVIDESERNVERFNQLIQKQRKAQLESAIGKTPETRAAEQGAMIKQILGYGVVFLLIGGICLIWGIFYFPAACAVAGYTRSFTATLNPSVGFDTIGRLGFDYVKIHLMLFAIVLMSGLIVGVIASVLAPFDLPGVGNVPARAIGSLFGFYFSVVFSCVIGLALYKAADRLKLFR